MPKAVVCTHHGAYAQSLQLRDVDPISTLPSHALKIRVMCAGLAFPDLLQVEGKYQVRLEPPYVPAAEVAGEVIATGPEVDPKAGWQVGDRVMGFASAGVDGRQCGGLSEEALLDSRDCVRLPSSVDFETGVTIMRNYVMTYQGIVPTAKLQEGETLLVLGAAGACGLAAIDLGKALGARVVACASSKEKLDMCRNAGADVVVDYETGGSEAFMGALRSAGVYRRIDVIFDAVGGRYGEAAFRALASMGRYVIFGFAAGGSDPKSALPNLPLNLVLMRGQQILGSMPTSALLARGDPLPSSVKPSNPMPELLQLVESGKLKPVVPRSYNLKDFMQAFDSLATRRAIGKVIVSSKAEPAPSARL